jgi:hypothetical protein
VIAAEAGASRRGANEAMIMNHLKRTGMGALGAAARVLA